MGIKQSNRGKQRTNCYKVYEYLRVKMYKRVNGRREKIWYTEEEYREIIEHAMEMLYNFHAEELEKVGLVPKIHQVAKKNGTPETQ